MIIKRGSVSRRSGNVSAMVAVSLVPMFTFLGICIDGGMLLTERRQCQSVADAAAMAAACYMYQTNYTYSSGRSTKRTEATARANEIVSAHGYSSGTGDGQAQTTVKFSVFLYTRSIYDKSQDDDAPSRVQSTSYSGYISDGCVEVTVIFYHARYFSSLWGNALFPIKCRATAKGLWTPIKDGIIILDPTSKASLGDSGGGTLKVDAPIIVNSNNSEAVVETNNGHVVAPELYVTGGASVRGSFNTSSGTATPTYLGIHPTPDPLAYLPVPDPATMSDSMGSGTMTNRTLSSGATVMYPGRYTSNIRIGPSDTVTMQPGIYYMDSISVSIQGTLTGSGVMIYMNNNSESNKDFSVDAQASVNISGPTSGTYKGMLIFQKRGSSTDVSITGGGNLNLGGTVYAAGANVKLAGNAGTNNVGSQFVSKQLTVTGTADVVVNYSSGTPANTRILTLVE